MSAKRAAASQGHARTSRDWELLVLNGEAGLAALCQVVREAWARGETTWRFDGLLSARQQEPEGAGAAAGIARGQAPGERPWQLRLALPREAAS